MSEQEHQDDFVLSTRLERERPVPGAGYRAKVGRWIELRERLMPTQGSQRRLALIFGFIGLVLALLALLGLAGAGPLG